MEPIEEEVIFQEYDEEEDDGLEIELHESQTKVADQSAALLVQQAHLHLDALHVKRTCAIHIDNHVPMIQYN